MAGQAGGRPREWVHAQLGRSWFIADKRYKLYQDGSMFDITDSPVAEHPLDASQPEVLAAKNRLAGFLGTLREGRPGVLEFRKPEPAGSARGKQH